MLVEFTSTYYEREICTLQRKIATGSEIRRDIRNQGSTKNPCLDCLFVSFPFEIFQIGNKFELFSIGRVFFLISIGKETRSRHLEDPPCFVTLRLGNTHSHSNRNMDNVSYGANADSYPYLNFGVIM